MNAVAVGFGRNFKLALLVPSAIALACLVTSIVTFLPRIEIVFLAASACALVAVAAATVLLIRRPEARTLGNILVSVLAAVASVPAFLILAFAIFKALPVTPWERTAISTAEEFVARHGYTAAGHPEDLPILANDIMDVGSAQEVAAQRRGTVQPRALGIIGVPGLGYSVVFEYTRPPPSVEGMPRQKFVVMVEPDGRAGTPHLMPMYPDWLYKGSER